MPEFAAARVTRANVDERDGAMMFELAPISLWLEDYSGLKHLFDQWRRAGVTASG